MSFIFLNLYFFCVFQKEKGKEERQIKISCSLASFFIILLYVCVFSPSLLCCVYNFTSFLHRHRFNWKINLCGVPGLVCWHGFTITWNSSSITCYSIENSLLCLFVCQSCKSIVSYLMYHAY